jgi:integrase
VLRKTCGTRIADGGGGVAAIATHLRHKDMQTANRYIDRTWRQHPRDQRAGELMEA